MRGIKNIFLFFLLLNIAQFCFAQNNKTTDQFSSKLFQEHLRFLGNDSLEGRAPGTKGGNIAAKYLADELKKIGLKPIDNNSNYFQYLPLHGSRPLYSSTLNIEFGLKLITFKLMEDFLMYQSNEPIFIPNFTEMVFVGYGIVADEFNYNDYTNIDVEGKIVVFLDGEPASLDSSYFNGNLPTIYSTPEVKQRIALSRGAKGSILIPDNNPGNNYNWQEKIRQFSFENMSLASTPSTNFDIIINPDIAGILFTGSGYTLEEILNTRLTYKLTSFPLQGKLTFQGKVKQRDFVSPNVIGILEGQDPDFKDSYVLITAHYDHLGIGPAVKGDSIYNGVFDNAAGVSALLELARVFSAPDIYKKRSIIFALLTCEEFGMLGSEYYVQNPVKPIYKTIADINIDGIASFDNFKSIVVLGEEFSSLSDLISNVANQQGLSISEIPKEFRSDNSFAKSDQFNFAKAGIPSALILDGIDYKNLSKEEGIKKLLNYSINIYHSPFDDFTQLINFDASMQHINLLFEVINELVNSGKEPEWNDNSPFKHARVLSKAKRK
jgi:hypothetical protein